MYIPKRYGQSKVDSCPFCTKQATVQNKQGIPVCQSHKDQNLDNLKCICGSFLEVKSGKFGPYFYCFKCGNINFRKALEFNAERLSAADYKRNNNYDSAKKDRSDNFIKDNNQKTSSSDSSYGKREITIRSDELD
jgi:hypothetical protein